MRLVSGDDVLFSHDRPGSIAIITFGHCRTILEDAEGSGWVVELPANGVAWRIPSDVDLRVTGAGHVMVAEVVSHV